MSQPASCVHGHAIYMHMYRNLPAGFENRVPVLFLDLHDDLVTPCEDDPEAAVTTGSLFGEKPETMINLPIISVEESGVSCAWTDHNYSLIIMTAALREYCELLPHGILLFIILVASTKSLAIMTVSMASLR